MPGGRPCPKCAAWRGMVLVDDVYSGGRPDGKHKLLSEAMAAGFLHPRCRDSVETFFPWEEEHPDPIRGKELEEAETAEAEESRQQNAERMAERWGRRAQYSLDPGDRRAAEARAEEWRGETGSGRIAKRANPGKIGTVPGKSTPTKPPAEWNRGVGPETWSASRQKALWTSEWGTTYKTQEEARLYDANGKRLFRKKGGSAEVYFAEKEIQLMKGGVLTHNHPGLNYGCFSPNDINMLRQGRLSEIRCVTPNGVFRIQHPGKWPTEIDNLEKLADVYYTIDKDASAPFFDRARKGELSFLEADNMGQEAAVRALCERYGIPFVFQPWDVIGEGIG